MAVGLGRQIGAASMHRHDLAQTIALKLRIPVVNTLLGKGAEDLRKLRREGLNGALIAAVLPAPPTRP